MVEVEKHSGIAHLTQFTSQLVLALQILEVGVLGEECRTVASCTATVWNGVGHEDLQSAKEAHMAE
jgi:hypothetical protein